MGIQHHIKVLNNLNHLKINQSNIVKSLEKLSSGLRINRAGDDAAGLSISEKNERTNSWTVSSIVQHSRFYLFLYLSIYFKTPSQLLN
jgi:hypothetical protein